MNPFQLWWWRWLDRCWYHWFLVWWWLGRCLCRRKFWECLAYRWRRSGQLVWRSWWVRLRLSLWTCRAIFWVSCICFLNRWDFPGIFCFLNACHLTISRFRLTSGNRRWYRLLLFHSLFVRFLLFFLFFKVRCVRTSTHPWVLWLYLQRYKLYSQFMIFFWGLQLIRPVCFSGPSQVIYFFITESWFIWLFYRSCPQPLLSRSRISVIYRRSLFRCLFDCGSFIRATQLHLRAILWFFRIGGIFTGQIALVFNIFSRRTVGPSSYGQAPCWALSWFKLAANFLPFLIIGRF